MAGYFTGTRTTEGGSTESVVAIGDGYSVLASGLSSGVVEDLSGIRYSGTQFAVDYAFIAATIGSTLDGDTRSDTGSGIGEFSSSTQSVIEAFHNSTPDSELRLQRRALSDSPANDETLLFGNWSGTWSNGATVTLSMVVGDDVFGIDSNDCTFDGNIYAGNEAPLNVYPIYLRPSL